MSENFVTAELSNRKSQKYLQKKYALPYSDDDRPYDFLCMVDNGWGDSGTCNIFILVRKCELGYEVEDLYMEYSCS